MLISSHVSLSPANFYDNAVTPGRLPWRRGSSPLAGQTAGLTFLALLEETWSAVSVSGTVCSGVRRLALTDMALGGRGSDCGCSRPHCQSPITPSSITTPATATATDPSQVTGRRHLTAADQ